MGGDAQARWLPPGKLAAPNMVRMTYKVVEELILGLRAVTLFNDQSKEVPGLSSLEVRIAETDRLIYLGAPISITQDRAVVQPH